MKTNTITMYCFRMVAVISLLLVMNQAASAQTGISQQEFWNDTLRKIALPSSNEKWIALREDAGINPLRFFQQYSAALRLTADDEMRLHKTAKDRSGFTHYRFQQYYRNIRVAGAEYIIHVNPKGAVYAANGRYVRSMDKQVSHKLSETTALQQALKSVIATRYMWQEKYWEEALKQRTKNPDTSYYPKGELIWTRAAGNDNWNSSNFRLAYQFDIFASSPRISKRIRVDALTGEIINSIPLEIDCTPASVNTIWNGNRSINTHLYASPDYRLYDNCDSAEIWVRDWNSTTNTGFPIEITSSNNTWTSNTQVFGGTVLWAIKSSTAYFKNTFTRKGWDNANSELPGFVNVYFLIGYDQNGNPVYSGSNAAADLTNGRIYIGGGSGTLASSFGTLDITGHEFTHLVTHTNTGLGVQNESGAIHESLSDIFGDVIESVTLGLANDYLLGEDRTDGAVRSMSNPNQYADPDTYEGLFWYTGPLDNGGIHTNSGVMNYWFYLLTSGGSGTNDKGNAFNVSAIGQSKTTNIIYKAYDYMTSTTNYADMRAATVAAAKDLYGTCSGEAYQAANAWYAVGVGSAPAAMSDGGVCGAWPIGGVYTYSATGTVTSPPAGCAGGTTTVSGATFTSFTGSQLVFLPGFTAVSGCNFLAYVTPCTPPTLQAASEPVYIADASQVVTNNATQKSLTESFAASVYPNPARATATLQLKGTKGAVSVTLTNMQGNILWRHDRLNTTTTGIPINMLAPGMYFINVRDEKHTKVLKLLKE